MSEVYMYWCIYMYIILVHVHTCTTCLVKVNQGQSGKRNKSQANGITSLKVDPRFPVVLLGHVFLTFTYMYKILSGAQML